MALRKRDLRLILDGARRLDLLHEVDAVRLRNREALRDSAALADGEQILAARLEVRDEPQRNGHDALAAVAEAHGAALRDAAGERVEHIIVEDARDRHVRQLPATEVASLRESFDTSICLDRPSLLHSQSCEVQQRSGSYQSHSRPQVAKRTDAVTSMHGCELCFSSR